MSMATAAMAMMMKTVVIKKKKRMKGATNRPHQTRWRKNGTSGVTGPVHSPSKTLITNIGVPVAVATAVDLKPQRRSPEDTHILRCTGLDPAISYHLPPSLWDDDDSPGVKSSQNDNTDAFV